MLSLALVSALVAVVLAWLILRSGIAKYWLDVPVERSLHVVPTPRLGGVALWLAVVTACGLWDLRHLASPLWLALGLVFGISLLDDRKALPANLRLLVHVLAGLLWAIAFWDNHWLILPTCLTLVWMANLYNFMDGADGLAGGMAVVGFAVLGLIALTQNHPLAVPAIAVAGAAAGFLLFNIPPARLFLGDAGSVPLGFLAAALGLWGVRDGLWTLWVPTWLFAPFILDASMTLMLRIMKGRKPWQAHREHLYQHVVLRGWTHRRLLAVAYPLMLLCAAWAWWLQKQTPADQQLWGISSCLLLTTVYALVRVRVAGASATAP